MPTEKITSPLSQNAFGGVKEGSVRVGPLMHLVSLLVDFKIDAKPLLEQMGHSSSLFSDPENTISIHDLGALIVRCVAVTSCPHFGLLLGQHGRLMGFGLLGEILPHCANVGTALAYLQDNFHLHDRGGMHTRTIEGDTVMLGYAILSGPIVGTDQLQDIALVMGLNIMRRLRGPTWKPRSAFFSRRRPVDIHRYQQLFRCPLEFDAEFTALSFAASDLELSIAGSDPEEFRLLSERLNNVCKQHDLSFLDQVRRVVQALILLHRCSVNEVAMTLRMNRRHLNRLLEKNGTSVRHIVNDVRCNLALRLLADTSLSIGKIAAALDYSGASAFNHTFQRWKGMSPLDWRRNNYRSEQSRPQDFGHGDK